MDPDKCSLISAEMVLGAVDSLSYSRFCRRGRVQQSKGLRLSFRPNLFLTSNRDCSSSETSPPYLSGGGGGSGCEGWGGSSGAGNVAGPATCFWAVKKRSVQAPYPNLAHLGIARYSSLLVTMVAYAGACGLARVATISLATLWMFLQWVALCSASFT